MPIENITTASNGTLLQKYNVNFSQYNSGTNVNSMCAEITFFNNGVATVVIQNCLHLGAGQSIAISGNQYELDTTQYTLGFTGAGQKSCVVIRKYYTS